MIPLQTCWTVYDLALYLLTELSTTSFALNCQDLPRTAMISYYDLTRRVLVACDDGSYDPAMNFNNKHHYMQCTIY